MNAKRVIMTACVVTATALMLTSCSKSDSADNTSTPAVTIDQTAAGLLPDSIKTKGKLTFGVDATYSPNEFKDASGNVTGWEIDLANAVAAKLGVTPDYVIASFDNIIPSVVGGKYDAGLSSFSDTPERQKTVDFVNYYSAGIQWATAAGKSVDPMNACGLKIAAQNGTTEVDDIKVKSQACTDAGKPAITLLGFDSQDLATQATTTGRADAMSADSPVTQYAVKQSGGKLELIGEPYDVVLYGIPLAKGNDALAGALKAALESLQADGTYTTILDKWGVTAGAVSSITINSK